MRSSLGRVPTICAVVTLLAGCTASGPPAPSSSQAAPGQCGSAVETGPLPEWARAGFSGDAAMAHVMGDRGGIVAAIFGNPLAVSRPDGSSNKILWVAKVPPAPGDLVIEAKLEGAGASETRQVRGGPGPSIIDFPRAGCWRLTLTWPDHTDTMDLVYK